MAQTAAGIALRSAAPRGGARVLLVTPGPHGAGILKELVAVCAGKPLTVLESSLERLAEVPRNVRRIRATARRLPFRRHTFECVLSFEALFSIRPPWTVLAEFHRVLVPDGTLILFEPQSLGLFSSLRDKVHGPGKRVFPLDELKARLARGDYRVESVEEFRSVPGFKRPAFCVRAVKLENPAEPAPEVTTTREMLEKRKAKQNSEG